MNKKLLFAGAILLALATIAIAADAVTGKWVYILPSDTGALTNTVTIDLKADGANLTGTVLQPMGGRGGGGAAAAGAPPAAPAPVAISNGKVDGNNVTFEVARGQATTKYQGKIVANGTYMDLTIISAGRGGGEPQSVMMYAKKSN